MSFSSKTSSTPVLLHETLIGMLFYNMFLQQHYTLLQHFPPPLGRLPCKIDVKSVKFSNPLRRGPCHTLCSRQRIVSTLSEALLLPQKATRHQNIPKRCAFDACKTCSRLKATPALCCGYVLCDSEQVCACLSNKHLARL